MGAQYIFTLHDVGKVVPPKRSILKGVSLSFLPGAKIGVVGGNGTGKSTLLRIMAGVDREFNGETKAAKNTSISYLAQEPELDATLDVKGNVEQAVRAEKELLARFEALSARLGEPMEPEEMEKTLEAQALLQDQIEAADAWDLDRRLEIAMDALRLPPADADVTRLSGGERRRVALCRVLLERPDMLLLDEPTNHLDAESVAWLERFLEDFPGTVVAVTHDRYFLDNVAQWILELDRGSAFPFEGNYTRWLEQKQKRLAVEEKQQAARSRIVARELEWIRSAPKARQSKGAARVARYEQLVEETKSLESLDPAVEIVLPPGPRLGANVVKAKGLSKGFGDRLLIDNLDFDLPRGGIVGVIGANGAGKTTLFRMLSGEEAPDSGSLTIGETVTIAYVDQSRDALDGDKNVWQEISGGQEFFDVGSRQVSTRAYVGSFNFRGSDQQKRVKELSGGERNRVHLAKLLRRSANLLLLDEPTNDLDVDTLRALEDAILRFPGCVVVTSHDRWFLDRIATHILAFEGDSHIEWFAGNYRDYEADRKKRLGTAADRPHRMRFKKLEH